MNRLRRTSIIAPGASAEEAAAVAAALARFMRDTAPPPAPEPPARSAWAEASLREGVARQPGLLPRWL
jgi:hypothetical protein